MESACALIVGSSHTKYFVKLVTCHPSRGGRGLRVHHVSNPQPGTEVPALGCGAVPGVPGLSLPQGRDEWRSLPSQALAPSMPFQGHGCPGNEPGGGNSSQFIPATHLLRLSWKTSRIPRTQTKGGGHSAPGSSAPLGPMGFRMWRKSCVSPVSRHPFLSLDSNPLCGSVCRRGAGFKTD